MKPDLKGLMKLGRYLEKVPRKNFDINAWLEEKESCGTAGCIAGHAAALFPRRFQKVEPYRTLDAKGNEVTMYNIRHRSSTLYGHSAFARGFKISDFDAARLTIRGLRRKRTPHAAAKAVFKLVEKLKAKQ